MIFRSPLHFIRYFWGLLGGSEFHFPAIAWFRELSRIILNVFQQQIMCPEPDPYFLLDYMNIISYSITPSFTKCIFSIKEIDHRKSFQTSYTLGSLLEIFRCSTWDSWVKLQHLKDFI